MSRGLECEHPPRHRASSDEDGKRTAITYIARWSSRGGRRRRTPILVEQGFCLSKATRADACLNLGGQEPSISRMLKGSRSQDHAHLWMRRSMLRYSAQEWIAVLAFSDAQMNSFRSQPTGGFRSGAHSMWSARAWSCDGWSETVDNVPYCRLSCPICTCIEESIGYDKVDKDLDVWDRYYSVDWTEKTSKRLKTGVLLV